MAKPRQQQHSIKHRLYRLFFYWVGSLFPRWAARLAANIWRRTHRFSMPGREQAWYESANREHLELEAGVINLLSWGDGPTVLLVHGWNGRGSQMASLMESLVAEGFRVVAFDAPGHGESDGDTSSLLEYIKSIKAIEERYGPFSAMVGHSFGAMAIQVALQQGVKAKGCVMIAGPISVRLLADRFTGYIKLPKSARRYFDRLFEERYGEDSWVSLSPETHAAKQTISALFIHDRQDRDVAYAQSEQLASSWPGAELFLTDGLGHRRILRSPKVIEAVSRFIVRVAA